VEEGDMGERGLQRFAFGLSQEDIVRSADEGINIGLDEYLTK
jgi:hypothetical protein